MDDGLSAAVDDGLSAAVIAGGGALRMGADKRAMLVDGIPLLLRAVAAVSRVADDVLIATTRGRPLPMAVPGVRVVIDRVSDGGPLAGIEAAMRVAAHPLLLVVAGDMPWIAEPLLRFLIARARGDAAAQAVAVQSDRGPEPLLALYRTTALPALTALVDGGERRVGRLLEVLSTVAIMPVEWRAVDSTGRSLVNFNRPSDLGLDGGTGSPK